MYLKKTFCRSTKALNNNIDFNFQLIHQEELKIYVNQITTNAVIE